MFFNFLIKHSKKQISMLTSLLIIDHLMRLKGCLIRNKQVKIKIGTSQDILFHLTRFVFAF